MSNDTMSSANNVIMDHILCCESPGRTDRFVGELVLVLLMYRRGFVAVPFEIGFIIKEQGIGCLISNTRNLRDKLLLRRVLHNQARFGNIACTGYLPHY